MESEPGRFHCPGSSICHRLSARLKIGLLLVVVVSVGLLPMTVWPVPVGFACLLLLGYGLAGISPRWLFCRLAAMLPVVGLVSLAAPISRGFTGGWDLAVTILLRATLCGLAAFWLVGTTPFSAILLGLRGWGMPRLLVMLLEFMHRYVFVLQGELLRMNTARRARMFGRRGLLAQWQSMSWLLGGLLVRSMNRAERIHGAMCARGWQGVPRRLDDLPETSADGRVK
jgi:cobalt/nickel transport system permease protein